MKVTLTSKNLFFIVLILSAGSILRFSYTFPEVIDFWQKRFSSAPGAPKFTGQHAHYLVFNLLFFVLLLLFRKRILLIFEKYVLWMHQVDFQREKRIVTFFVAVFLTTYLYKIHFGFWHKGVGGWTYASEPNHFLKHYPDSFDSTRVTPPFLQNSLVPENAKYLKQSGMLKGNAMFLHYQNGQVLPANYGLFNLSWAARIFRYPIGPAKADEKMFLDLLKAGLERQKHGTRFMLPNSISYNNHMTYMKIDYRSYPDPESLKAISFWEILVRVHENKNIEVVDWKELNTINL